MLFTRPKTAFLASFFGLTLVVGACASEPEAADVSRGGSGGAAGGSAGAQAGTTVLPGGAGGSVAMAGGGAGTTPIAGTAGSAAGGGGAAGAVGTGGGGGAGGGKVPACMTPKVEDGVSRAASNYIECDVEDQAIDFDVAAAYPQPRKPGYDPVMTAVSFTDFGTAFSGSAVQECHPYCYKGNLTIGLDMLKASEPSLKGEVLFAFPPTVAPIANAKGRLSLGWLFVDGPALPAGTKLTVQMVLKSMDKPVALGEGTHDVTPGTWFEFKYFPIDDGFGDADLLNVTHIGFRATLAPAAMAQDWHGVIYADHFQLRK